MPAHLENLVVATGLENVSFHSNPKEGKCQRMFKLSHNSIISYDSKIMLKILQARLHRMWTEKYQMYNLDLEKEEEPEIKLTTSVGS